MSHPDHVKQQNVAETSGSVVTESLFHNHGINSFVLLNQMYYITLEIETKHKHIVFRCY
ncbi:hypothetical protein HanRHA438_Chr08g0369111 [Helianthus annuus]|nr:hypothetical protein HanRHA438_Chr08g0369111 [Helianthus annuus]